MKENVGFHRSIFREMGADYSAATDQNQSNSVQTRLQTARPVANSGPVANICLLERRERLWAYLISRLMSYSSLEVRVNRNAVAA